ncbi:MAG: exodeoxyribonuclease VII small subunit [Candidatus Hydrogenedentes bacterium]|nr:exodeoxyribonuclease VII small subunit [Candidatus Hydrogenedentota bacterium]
MPEPKFEKDLEKLEKIVDTLEEGGLPLDDSIKKFEEGIKLAKRCEKALSAAEKKIEVLTKDAQGKVETKPFADDEEEEDDDEEDDEADRDDDGELLF